MFSSIYQKVFITVCYNKKMNFSTMIFFHTYTNRKSADILRESISRGYPFFFVRKGHKYFFYSVLPIHLSPYN